MEQWRTLRLAARIESLGPVFALGLSIVLIAPSVIALLRGQLSLSATLERAVLYLFFCLIAIRVLTVLFVRYLADAERRGAEAPVEEDAGR